MTNSNLRFKTSALQLLFEQSHVAFTSVFVNSVIYVLVSWNFVNHGILLAWLLVTYLFTVLRFFLVKRWSKQINSLKEREIDKLFKKIKIGIGISGLLWGLTGVIVALESGTQLSVTTFLLAGMTAGAVGAYAISLQAICFFLFPALLPLIVRLFIQTGIEYYSMGIMGVGYLILMILIGRNVNKRTVQFVELGLENEDLISRLNNASHEIRTPVAAISGFAELLKYELTASETVRKSAETIYRNSMYLKKLVENTLFLSKTETPSMVDSVILKDDIASTLHIVEKKLKEKNLNLNLFYESSVPEKIYTNAMKFQQILINLLNNAIKFTNAGTISVKVSYAPEGRLFVNVADTGIGIHPEVRDKLFEPFFRENRPEVKSQEGSGLGLALSRKLAQSLGGDLRLIKTEINKGTEFQFDIAIKSPLEVVKEQPKSMDENSKLAGKTIVLVDDNEDIQFLVRRQLEAEGAKVKICSDGQLAVELISRNHDYDLILMDLNMPIMDGYVAAEMIRKKGYTKPILALTAYTSLDQNKYAKSGFNEYISKPIGTDDFIGTVKKWVSVC